MCSWRLNLGRNAYQANSLPEFHPQAFLGLFISTEDPPAFNWYLKAKPVSGSFIVHGCSWNGNVQILWIYVKQIKSTFLFGIIKNVTCRLKMDISGLGIDIVDPKLLLPRIFFSRVVFPWDFQEVWFQILPERWVMALRSRLSLSIPHWDMVAFCPTLHSILLSHFFPWAVTSFMFQAL